MKLTRAQLLKIIKESIGPMPGEGVPKTWKDGMKDVNKLLAKKFDMEKLKDGEVDDQMRSEIFKSIESTIGPPIKSTIFKDSDDWEKIGGLVYTDPKLPKLEKEWEEVQTWPDTMGKLKDPDGYPGFAWRFATMMALRRLELEDRLDVASTNLDQFMLDKLKKA